MDSIRIAIADDHLLFREGLATIISTVPNFEVIINVDNGQKLITALENAIPDVVLLDLKMPVMDGLQTTEYIKLHHPDIKIIILTMHDSEDFILHMLKLGVNAYLLKNSSSQQVRQAIQTTHNQGYYFDKDISQVMLKGLKKKHIPKPKLDNNVRLTPREVEVLTLICKEYTNTEIADKLFISNRTVETHRKNMLEKLGVKNTAGLVMKAVMLNLCEVGLV